MKKIVSVIISLIFTFGIAVGEFDKSVISVEAAYLYGNFDYEIYSNKITITGFKGQDTEITIPETIDSKPVIRIKGNVDYKNADKILKINLPKSITDSGVYVKYPDTTSREYLDSFKTCTNLEEINVLPENENYTSVDGVLFSKDMKTLVRYPIGKKETTYTVPESVTTIGSNAFAGCNNLTKVILPGNLEKIEGYAFYNCINIKELSIPENCICSKDYSVGFYPENEKKTVIPDFKILCYNNDADAEINYYLTAKKYAEAKTIPFEIITNHDFGEWETETPATCTENGRKVRKCKDCEKTETEIISATGHNFSDEWIIDKTATCTETGEKSHHCKNCAERKDITEIPVKSHNFGEWETETPATCTENGRKVRKCKDCKKTETEIISATGHSFSDEWIIDKTATCTETGEKSHHCKNCAERKDITEISVNSHNFGEWEIKTPATCTENGEKVRKCKDCEKTETEIISATGHSFSDEWIIDKTATCTETGEKSHHCKNCAERKDITEIPVKSHNFGEWETETPATCTENGRKARKCKDCGKTEMEIISATGHNFSDEWIIDKTATCTETGEKSHHCKNCAERKDITEIPVKSHNFGEWEIKTPATCTENGRKVRKCKDCGETETEIISAEGHKFNKDDTVSPTYDAEGYTIYKCTVCGNSEKRDFVPELEITDNSLANEEKEEISNPAEEAEKNNATNISDSSTSETVTKAENSSSTDEDKKAIVISEYKKSKKTISKAKITDITDKTYTGRQIKPALRVVMGKTILKNGKDYYVKYGTNKIGKGTVTIVGKGIYTGKIVKTFKINPSKTAVSLKSGKKKITVSIAKRAEANRYKIQLCTNKYFKNAKSVIVKDSKKTFVAKSEKIYYVRVCAIRNINGKNYAGSWSAVKKIKVK